ncbi:hypothetical protein [Agreia sp. VKM Ac-1783]|uniref:hypothetical protein n=1 Tax=Agreia sp. VKM Ac-1783 TaxID=1938889 RepID=UPI000A2AEB64|nr:hypothetical protein [Agreia sp. VKM Ac-1783]SMQ74822.1 hypothetical protein SAMN06295943_3217 [Agreia sp. VKM Ac-1783]
MARWTARILGIIVALLAVVGFFVEGEHLAGIANVDLTLDIARVIIAVALLWVGFGRTSASALRAVLAIVGIMYVAMALLAFADSTLFGLLPTGFTGFDIGFHLVTGIISVIAAFVPVSNRGPVTARA